MASALIDRLVHRCHIVHIRGNSYPMRRHTDLQQLLHPQKPAAPRCGRAAWRPGRPIGSSPRGRHFQPPLTALSPVGPVGIFAGSRQQSPRDRRDLSGNGLDCKCGRRLPLRTSRDTKGRRQRPFADLCLTTWLRLLDFALLMGLGGVEQLTSLLSGRPRQSASVNRRQVASARVGTTLAPRPLWPMPRLCRPSPRLTRPARRE